MGFQDSGKGNTQCISPVLGVPFLHFQISEEIMLFQTLLGPLARKLLLYGAICLVNGVLGWLILHRRKAAVPDDAKPLAWLGFVLPFASGGFYSFAAVPVGIYLVWYIVAAFKRNGQLTFRWNLSTAAILLLPLAYACSVAWAADKGMAPFGFVHTFPLLLYPAATRCAAAPCV